MRLTQTIQIKREKRHPSSARRLFLPACIGASSASSFHIVMKRNTGHRLHVREYARARSMCKLITIFVQWTHTHGRGVSFHGPFFICHLGDRYTCRYDAWFPYIKSCQCLMVGLFFPWSAINLKFTEGFNNGTLKMHWTKLRLVSPEQLECNVWLAPNNWSAMFLFSNWRTIAIIESIETDSD